MCECKKLVFNVNSGDPRGEARVSRSSMTTGEAGQDGALSQPTGVPVSLGPRVEASEGVLASDPRSSGQARVEGETRPNQDSVGFQAPAGIEGETVGGLGNIPMNPFWSPERRAMERLAYGEFNLGGIVSRGDTGWKWIQWNCFDFGVFGMRKRDL